VDSIIVIVIDRSAQLAVNEPTIFVVIVSANVLFFA